VVHFGKENFDLDKVYSLLKYGQDGQRAKLLDENGQLCAIFTTIIKNTNPKG